MRDGAARLLDAKILSYLRAPRPARYERLALQLFRHQYERSRVYRAYCGACRTSPDQVRRWRDIPALPVTVFKEARVRSFTGRPELRFHTSGTTGGASRRGTHELESARLYRTSLWASFRKHLLGGVPREPYLLVPTARRRPDSSLSYMASEVCRRMGRPERSYVTASHRVEVRRLTDDLSRERRPALIFATAFSLKIWLDHLKDTGTILRLARGSRLMETGGFKGRTEAVSRRRLHALCVRRLGLAPSDCRSEYGMTELSSQAYARGASGRFRLPPWMRAIAADPLTGRQLPYGRRGVLRFYDLANRSSVMAVQTEDAGRVYPDGFELEGRLSGAELRGCSLSYEQYLMAGRRGDR
ncbi:MAG: hypothetical protein MOGMAGMI_00679 [Candidatus Omnitrophica bacterium]|nr:hypothetical protein [Candidatus Omnitrophota bacterium]